MYYDGVPYRIALNSYRKMAKHQFSKLYKKAIRKGRPKQESINDAHVWLNNNTGVYINHEMKHLTITKCKQIIKIIEPYVRKYR